LKEGKGEGTKRKLSSRYLFPSRFRVLGFLCGPWLTDGLFALTGRLRAFRMKLFRQVVNVFARLPFCLDGVNINAAAMALIEMPFGKTEVKNLVSDQIRDGAVRVVGPGMRFGNRNYIFVFFHVSL
jgi:hypothetical protein